MEHSKVKIVNVFSEKLPEYITCTPNLEAICDDNLESEKSLMNKHRFKESFFDIQQLDSSDSPKVDLRSLDSQSQVNSDFLFIKIKNELESSDSILDSKSNKVHCKQNSNCEATDDVPFVEVKEELELSDNIVYNESNALHGEQDSNSQGKSFTIGEMNRICERGQIVAKFREGKGIKAICRELGCGRNTARKWIRRYQENEDLSTKPKPGAKRKTTPAQDLAIVKRSLVDSKMTTIEIAQEEGLANVCSKTTVRRRLHEAGIRHRVSTSKATIPGPNIRDKISLCEQHVKTVLRNTLAGPHNNCKKNDSETNSFSSGQ